VLHAACEASPTSISTAPARVIVRCRGGRLDPERNAENQRSVSDQPAIR